MGQTVLARLIESQIWHPPAGSMGEELRKADSGLCPPFFLGKTVPPTSTLIPDISFPPYMPLVPFKLLPRHWSSDRVSLSPCVDSLRRTAWDSRSFFHRLNPCWFLQPEVMGTCLPGTGMLGRGAWCAAGTPCS